MKLADGLESEENLTINKPQSILTGRTNDDLRNNGNQADKSRILQKIKTNRKRVNDTQTTHVKMVDTVIAKQPKKEFPTRIMPMLSTLVDKPFNSKKWVFEVKWDGVRSILLLHKSNKTLELQSRNGKSITHRYPELIKTLSYSMSSSPSSSNDKV